MMTKQSRLFTLLICAAFMIVGMYTTALKWEQRDARVMNTSTVSRPVGIMSTGVTVTDSDPPSYASISKAVPLITVPARCHRKIKGYPVIDTSYPVRQNHSQRAASASTNWLPGGERSRAQPLEKTQCEFVSSCSTLTV